MELERKTLTVREAATILGIRPARLYELIARGTFPAIRFGRQIRISRSALERILDADTK